MSDSSPDSRSIQVLHVDDEPSFSDLVSTFLERTDDQLDVTTADSAGEALSVLDSTIVDCIVSDHDMPGTSGLEFLAEVRERDADLPFILFTGKGSEEIASDAIGAGVTDYFEKKPGGEQYELLANRIRNAVEQYRANRAVSETETRFRELTDNANDVLWMFTADWEDLLFVNDQYAEIYGPTTTSLESSPQTFLDAIHPDDRSRVKDAMARLSSGESVDLEYRVNETEDYSRWVWVQGEPIIEDDEVARVAGFTRDITDRKERERQLEEFANVISHDLRNPLMSARGYLELAESEGTADHFERVEHSLDRMDRIISDVLWLARQGEPIGQTQCVPLADAVRDAWQIVAETDTDASIEISDGLGTVTADPDRLAQLLENVLGNAIDHAGDDAIIRVDPTEDGFAFEDDGPGIPAEDRERVFDHGFSTRPDGTGFGLSIVSTIADAHGWQVALEESSMGGVRLVITTD